MTGTTGLTLNPFPGPQPYRASDRRRFFGRDDAAKRLTNSILANRCLTLFGPSGSGKSSLMQAKVIPELEDEHDFRCVWIEGWPPGLPPVAWLLDAVYTQLRLGERLAEEGTASDSLEAALELAERRSDRPILIYLDQLEQLLYTSRDPKDFHNLMAAMGRITDAAGGEARVVLSLREDYLGRFRDRARGRKRLLEHGYRLGPLTVGEMTWAVRTAAAKGDPPQEWAHDQVWALMLDVRVPGESPSDTAEVQAAFAQIVCRALFAARNRSIQSGSAQPAPDARVILDRYLDTTLASLGSLRETALNLLEEYLIAGDGSRTLLTEREAHAAIPGGGLQKILETLEGAAILRAEEHQGGRYFELGHDWLAKKVFDLKSEREAAEKARRLEAERKRELERAQRAQRRWRLTVLAAVVTTLVTGALGLIAFRQSARAHLLTHMSSARELAARNQQAYAAKLLLEVPFPQRVRGWDALALDALTSNVLKAVFRGHEDAVTRAVFSPDGKRVATASLDGTARIFRTDGRGDPIILRGHSRAIYALVWDARGEKLVTASRDKSAIVWSSDGKESTALEGAGGPVLTAMFDPTGTKVLTASEDGIARIYSIGPAAKPIELPHDHPLRFAAFSPDGQKIVTTGENGLANLWNADGSLLGALEGHSGVVHMAAFSPDGAHLATAAEDRKARIYEAGNPKPIAVLEVHGGEVYWAAWSPDGASVATVSEDKTACVWRPFEHIPPLSLIGHEGPVVHAAWGSDGQQLITSSNDNTARVWKPNRRGEAIVLRGHAGRVLYAMINPDNEGAVTASSDGTARLWSRSGQGRIAVLRGHRGPVRTVTYDREGKRLLTASEDGTVRTWTNDGTAIATYASPQRDAFNGAAFSPNGKFVAGASDRGTILIWDTSGPAESNITIDTKLGPAHSVAWSPDGAKVAIGSASGAVLIAAAAFASTPAELGRHEGEVRSVAWSPDGTRVASASADGQARVWKVDAPGAPIARMIHRGAVNSVEWSAKGDELVTASSDRKIRIWNAEGVGEPKLVGEHNDTAYSASWSPSGHSIISSGEDNTARLWSLEYPGSQKVEEHKTAVRSAAMSPKEDVLATAADDDLVRLWELDIGVLLQRLRDSSTVCLLPQMRMRYLDETIEEARREYAACEKSYERTPIFDSND